MIAAAKLTIEGLRAIDVEMERPVQTSGGEIRSAPLVLMDLRTREGVVGVSPGLGVVASCLWRR